MPKLTKRPVRSVLLLVAVAVACSVGDLHRHSPRAAGEALDAETIASIREARLRKLHLVRPDLIHYPLAIDVVC